MEKEESCDTALSLGLNSPSNLVRQQPNRPPPPPVEPYLTLTLSDEFRGSTTLKEISRLSSPHSTLSSFSTTNIIKRERNDAAASSSRASEEEEDAAARKKLRLTKQQSALLEDRFKEHSSLNPKQKQELAKQLNLRPRQIEVWFQNRRARTKLKQTEVDCEFLRRCCETLTEENRKLQQELQELKAFKFATPSPQLFMQLPAAALTVCPSCERIAGGADATGVGDGRPKYFFNPFAHSTAC